jgi:hypothetical protein
VRLFLYGTLLDARTLSMRGGQADLASRIAHATLRGWQRVAARGGRSPTLCRDRTGQVTGVLIDVPARAMGRLAAYEGPAYRLTQVVVATANGKTSARTWIASAGTRRPWKAKGS